MGSEETGLQEHTEENCLYCVGASVLGYPTQLQFHSAHARTGEQTHPLALKSRVHTSADFDDAMFTLIMLIVRSAVTLLWMFMKSSSVENWEILTLKYTNANNK